MNHTRKLVLCGVFIAISVVFNSLIIIPVGPARIAPVQHFMNVLSGVMLGPWYACAAAFVTSVLRIMMGTGSVFAFPGSMIGAFLAGFVWTRTRHLLPAALGELVGTGILGAMAAALIALPFTGKAVALFGFVPAFFASSLVGSCLAFLLLKAFAARGLIHD